MTTHPSRGHARLFGLLALIQLAIWFAVFFPGPALACYMVGACAWIIATLDPSP